MNRFCHVRRDINLRIWHLVPTSHISPDAKTSCDFQRGTRRRRVASFRMDCRGTQLKRDPDATFVIATAFVIVAIMTIAAIPTLMEVPVVGMIIELHARGIDPVIGMPAVAVVIAGDASRSGTGGADQRARRDNHDDSRG